MYLLTIYISLWIKLYTNLISYIIDFVIYVHFIFKYMIFNITLNIIQFYFININIIIPIKHMNMLYISLQTLIPFIILTIHVLMLKFNLIAIDINTPLPIHINCIHNILFLTIHLFPFLPMFSNITSIFS
eukprot:62792_1